LKQKKKKEAEEAAEKKRIEEEKKAEDLRKLMEIERTNKLYAITIGALAVGGAIAVGAYMTMKNNQK